MNLIMINRRSSGFTLLEIMVTVCILAVLMSICLPAYFNMVATANKNTCIVNMYQITGAVSAWAIDHNVPKGSSVGEDQFDAIFSYIKDGKPMCPAKGIYAINPVGQKFQVRCSLENKGHKLPE